MAKNLGVSPAYINLIEQNQRSLSIRILVGLACDTAFVQLEGRDPLHLDTVADNPVPDLRGCPHGEIQLNICTLFGLKQVNQTPALAVTDRSAAAICC
mgnify:CR=1 FL=1